MSTMPFDNKFSPSGAELAEMLPEASPTASVFSDGPPLGGNIAAAAYPSGVPRQLAYPTYPAWGLLEQTAAIVPQRVATNLNGIELTYAQVQSAVLRLANWLQSTGLQSGDRVAVLLPNMPETMVALNGIWKAGGVAVSASPLSVPGEIAALLTATQCRRVICLDMLSRLLSEVSHLDATLLASLRDYLPAWSKVAYSAALWNRTGHLFFPNSKSQIWFWDAIARSEPRVVPSETLPGCDPAYILSTGGTTGNPKAVTLSHRNIVANAWQQSRWAGATVGEETMLAVLPFFHSYGMSTMLASGAALGATLFLQPRFEVRKVIAAIERHRPTVFHAVPAMLAAMNNRLRHHPANLRSLKWVISGGAPLPNRVAEEFAMHSGAIVVQGYGLSEASPVTHVGPLDGTNEMGSIGLPLPDTDCRVVDAETGLHEVPDGEVGELLVRGPQVMLGYWNNPTATAQVIQEGWLHTGDLVTRNALGFFRIVDRKKDLIITSGFNVYPADVEEVLRAHESVADAAVVGVPDAQRGEVVKAFVELKPGWKWEPKKLAQYCKQHLAAHRRPRLWEHSKSGLPKNFLGKVIRRQLRESHDSVAPGGET